MSKYFYFWVLWALTGSPLTAILVLIGAWALTDWLTFGFARRAVRFVIRARRGARLAELVMVNPHDRKARAEYGEILLEQRRAARALEILKPALEKEPDDLELLFLTGVACVRAGHADKGEVFIKAVLAVDPLFRRGEPWLEMGRGRLAHGDARGAIEPIAAWLEKSPGSVKGRFLLARAHETLGEREVAAREKERCWREFTTEPPFQRRVDRLWAWRAKPSRPLAYGAVLLAAMLTVGWFVRSNTGPGQMLDPSSLSGYTDSAATGDGEGSEP